MSSFNLQQSNWESMGDSPMPGNIQSGTNTWHIQICDWTLLALAQKVHDVVVEKTMKKRPVSPWRPKLCQSNSHAFGICRSRKRPGLRYNLLKPTSRRSRVNDTESRAKKMTLQANPGKHKPWNAKSFLTAKWYTFQKSQEDNTCACQPPQ